ncbi:ADP-ribosylglycohydrolase family protein [Nakamurella deserti]|uniref:ADP-ribosylglycohydrolase family protein n=1 Tax=Nakamurella deserti TaxID=2164074 RepID=UPI000DBE33A1|nr:ADP-ribosylglycohydrolase family protein [Nakamurella deserti]
MRLTPAQSDRAAGVLLASAAGDALGAGYEFTYPARTDTIAMIGGGPFGFAPGEWTDDTSMSIAVARVAAQGIDLRTPAGLDAVAAGFIEWYDSEPKDIGNQTRAVLSHRDRTGAEMQATAAGLDGLKGGNGSLMRTAAVGIAYLDDAEACAEAARAVSELTHVDTRAGEACQLWSHAIRHAVIHGNFDGVQDFLDRAPVDVSDYWRPLIKQAETGRPPSFPNNGWVVHALQTAWWAITSAPADDARHLQAALELAVRAGHDTDTTAAIAGALLGARWGASAVPAKWRRILHGWPGLRSRDLVVLAALTATGGSHDRDGWPGIDRLDYAANWHTSAKPVPHPHDSGVFLGGYDAVFTGKYDAVVSLCRMGSATLDADHTEFWLIDAGPRRNPNLAFLLDDAARTIQELRAEGKTVLLHCVQGLSRTPSVAARYSVLLGRNPEDVLTAMQWSHPNPELWAAAIRPPTAS